MSESVILPNGEEAEIIESRSILSRGIASDPNIDAKGGESPSFYLDKFSKIQPVYIIGALPGVLSSSSSSSMVTRTYGLDSDKVCAAGAWTFGTFIEVPDGATKVSIMVKRKDNNGAVVNYSTYGLDGSLDGVTGFLTATSPANNGLVNGLRDKTLTPPTQYFPEWITHPSPNLGAANYPVPALNQTMALPPWVRVALYNNDAAAVTFDLFVVVQ